MRLFPSVRNALTPGKMDRMASATGSRFRCLALAALTLGALAVGAGMGLGAYFLWFQVLRGQPRPETRALFHGVRYERRVMREPRVLVAHVVRVDMDAPGIGFLVTPLPANRRARLEAQTTSRFLAQNRLQLAINGDFFRPFRSEGLWRFYPQPGEPVRPFGLSCSRRRCTGRPSPARPTLYFSCRGRATFRRPADPCHAISGISLLRNGRARTGPLPELRHPRTAAALDRREQTLILLVVDGRQPGYSEGVTPRELARLALEAGGHNAIHLDGGGSSTLVMQHGGKPRQLNTPMHTRLAGRERPVANHLGVRARPLK